MDWCTFFSSLYQGENSGMETGIELSKANKIVLFKLLLLMYVKYEDEEVEEEEVVPYL